MGEHIKKIDKIRGFYQRNKGKLYPIENDKLKELDEYNKSLYIKVLCSIASYAEEVPELQTAFLKRIVEGCACEQKLEEYMKKALDIKIEDYNEFIEQYKDSELKYRFCIDGMILVGVNTTSSQKQLELLSEIIELLKVNSEEVNYLSQVARSIIEQSSELFNKAQENKVEQIKNELFFGYIKDFYVGLYIDEYDEKYYFASKLSALEIDLEDLIQTSRVTFENLIISMDKDWNFEGNEKVVFKNCRIKGNDHKFYFKSIKELNFNKCRLNGFQKRVAILEGVDNIYITNSSFDKCGYIDNNNAYGGLFQIWRNKANKINKISLIESEFLNCYVYTTSCSLSRRSTGVIIDASSIKVEYLEVKRCKFVGCKCKNNKDSEELLIYNIFTQTKEVEENEYVGEVQKLIG